MTHAHGTVLNCHLSAETSSDSKDPCLGLAFYQKATVIAAARKLFSSPLLSLRVNGTDVVRKINLALDALESAPADADADERDAAANIAGTEMSADVYDALLDAGLDDVVEDHAAAVEADQMVIN